MIIHFVVKLISPVYFLLTTEIERLFVVNLFVDKQIIALVCLQDQNSVNALLIPRRATVLQNQQTCALDFNFRR